MTTDNHSVIELQGVSAVIGGTQILRDVDWRIGPGEHWALIGANGSGKTTLLRVVTGYLWPTTGAVSVLGRRFGQVDLRQLRRRIGWVSSALASRMTHAQSVEEVVLSGVFGSIGLYDQPNEALRERANERIAQFALQRHAGQSYRTCSAGEQQKALIARALMAQPRLLILDEPCAGLDLRGREELLGLLQGLAEDPDGPTIVMVTHHIEEVFPAISHAMLLAGGAASAAGPVETVLTGPNVSGALGVDVRVRTAGGRFWLQTDCWHG